jgi:hypothetical protein
MTTFEQDRAAVWCLLVAGIVASCLGGYVLRIGHQPLSAARDDGARIIWRLDAAVR